jgi:hypothetical protein
VVFSFNEVLMVFSYGTTLRRRREDDMLEKKRIDLEKNQMK